MKGITSWMIGKTFLYSISEGSFGTSSLQSPSQHSLRIINLFDSLSSNRRAPLSTWNNFNLGRSIHHLLPIDSLSNTTREHSLNALSPNRSDFKLDKSIHHVIPSHSLFNSNTETYLKLLLLSFNSPISMTSKEGTLSISHTI